MIGLPSPLRGLLATGAALAVAGGAAGPASAATVETRPDPALGASSVVVTAAPGERNDLTLTRVDDFTQRVSDPVSPLEPGNGCRRLTPTSVECTTGAGPSGTNVLGVARVDAGDGNDTVRSSGTVAPALVANGGPGDDLLAGTGSGSHDLDGGGGRDQLFGGDSEDRLTDGDTSGAADADVLDGGAGEDTLDLSARTADLRIDLVDAATDGEAREGDTVRAVEHLIGGSGDDTFGGDDAGNTLEGGPGADRLDGLLGDDQLFGGPGRDVLRGHGGGDELTGGPGRDRLRSDGGADRIFAAASGEALSCGRGSDSLIQPGRALIVPPTCEFVSYSSAPTPETDGHTFGMSPFGIRAAGRTVRFRLGCPRTAGGCPVDGDGTLQLRTAGGRIIGATLIRWVAGRRTRGGTVRLTRTGARLAARPRGVLVTVRIDPDRMPPMVWRFRLRTAR